MANEVPAGTYHILNVSNTNLALDLSGNKTANRSNVQVFTFNYSDAQVWNVSYRTDGTCQLTHRFSGKCMEVYGLNLSQGANVSLFSDNDSDAQQWTLQKTGNKVSYGGTQYDSYYILLDKANTGSSKTWMAECDGRNPTPGRNVCIAEHTQSEASETDRHWIFVPIPKYKDGGLYTIHSVMDPKMVWDVNGLSKANGANLMLHTPNGGNNQKFVLVKNGNFWYIRSLFSGKNIQAASVSPGANIRQWAATDDLAQWKIVEYGTKTVDGKSCQVVSFGVKSNVNMLADAAGAKTSDGTNIFLIANNQGANQEWALKPVDALDANMPVPFDLGLAETVGGAGAKTRGVRARLYPTWKCSDAWVTSGSNHYEWRYRRRYMSSYSSSWGAWEAWTAWGVANVTIKGQQAWVTEGIPATYEWSSYKNEEFNFEVRSVGVTDSGTQNLHSGTASVTCNIVRQPTAQVTADVTVDPDADGVAFSPEGIRLDFTSDYDHGSTGFVFYDVIGANGKSILKTWQQRYGQGGDKKDLISKAIVADDGTYSVLIPIDALTRWPADGERVSIKYAPYYDQWEQFGGGYGIGSDSTATVDVNHDQSEGATAEPTLVPRRDRTLLATVPHIGTERMWVRGADGTLSELKGKLNGNVTEFVVPFPFDEDFELWTSVINDDDTVYATDVTVVSKSHPALAGYRPCHVWTWDGGSAVLELREGQVLSTDYKLEGEYEALVLNDRRRDAVSFASVRHGSFEAEGHVVPALGGSIEGLEDMVGRHVTYRSPSGRVANVAVTGISLIEVFDRTEVQVSMIEED